MSASRPLDPLVMADHVSEVVDYSIELLNEAAKEAVILALRTTLASYFEAYRAFYPDKPTRKDYQPKVLMAVNAYSHILEELLDKSIWREGAALTQPELTMIEEQLNLKLTQLLVPYSKNEDSAQVYLRYLGLIGRLLLGEKIEDKQERDHLEAARLLLKNRDNSDLQKEFKLLVQALTMPEHPLHLLKRVRRAGDTDELETDLEYAERIEGQIELALMTKEQLAAKKRADRLKWLDKLDPKLHAVEQKAERKAPQPALQPQPQPDQKAEIVNDLLAALEKSMPEPHSPEPEPAQSEMNSSELLAALQKLILEKYPDEQSPWHKAGKAVHQQAGILNLRFMNDNNQAELTKLQGTLRAAIAVLRDPSEDSRRVLNAEIAGCADAANYWRKLLGALTILAGFVLMTLSAASGVFTAGGSIASGWAGAALSSCGATIFYSGTQGPMAKSLSNLNALPAENNPRP